MRERPPWWLRLCARWCRCRCHVRPTEPDLFGHEEDGTLTHHDRACCSRYYGTVNRGWSGWRNPS